MQHINQNPYFSILFPSLQKIAGHLRICKNSLLLFLAFLDFQILSAQYHSITHEQSTYYSQFSHFTEQEFDSLNGTDPLLRIARPATTSTSCALNKMVFGWHPYWVGSVYNNYQWNLLSDLSYFSYEVDATTGEAVTTHGWATATVIDVAKANGVRVNLCVTLFSDHATFFGNSTAQQTLISNLIDLVQSRGANGVNIDFEGVPSSQKTSFNNFMVSLSNQMHAAIPGSQVSMALYAVDWNGIFDMSVMGSAVDYFMIMGYDYYYTGSTTAGPNDPLFHFGSTYNYTLSKSITYYLSIGCPEEKLVLGLPWYGREYTTTSGTVPSSVLNPPNSASRTLKAVHDNTGGDYTNANHHFDAESYSPYYVYQTGGEWKQCFIDNSYSLKKRMDLVHQRELAGIGIWALGYDDGYTEYWDAIADKLSDCKTVACTDTIFDMGGPNKNYYDKENYSYTISPDGATSVTLSFLSFDVEQGYDSLFLYDGSSTTDPLIGKYTGTNSPGTVSSTTGHLTVRFKSDNATTKPGFVAIWTCSSDTTPPITSLSTPDEWVSDNFTLGFTDVDEFSGIDDRFYQVLDFNGTEWRANGYYGFINDNFGTGNIHSDWTTVPSQGGNWQVNSGALNQSDEAASNPNIYLSVTQTSGNSYLYHWQQKFNGASTNQRGGIYLFCSDATQTQRMDAYMIYFRYNPGGLGNQVEIYKSQANAISGILHSAPIVIGLNTYYDLKVTYHPNSGELSVFLNNDAVTTWTDSSPLQSGNFISLRTGGTNCSFDDIKVYKSRSTNATVTVGDQTKEVRHENLSPTTPACRIKSIVLDSARNVSAPAALDVNVDLTPPAAIPALRDGLTDDADTTHHSTALSANWDASTDHQSGIRKYQYAVGLASGSDDVLGWTDNDTDRTATATGLNLVENTLYYFSVKAENHAGLFSTSVSTDGIRVLLPPANVATTADNPLTDGTRAELSWTTTSDRVDQAAVRYRKTGTTQWSYAEVNPYAPQLTLGELQPVTTYEWRIQLKRNGQNTHLSEPDTFVTLCSPKPRKPDSLQTLQVESNSATLKWHNRGNCDVSQVKIRYRKSGDLTWKFAMISPYADSLLLSGLYPSSDYEWRVFFRNDTLNSNLSDWAYFTTPASRLDEIGSSSFDAVLSPNPFTTILTIQIPETEPVLFTEIFDLTGRNVSHYFSVDTSSKERHVLSTAQLSPGIYFIRLTTEEGSYSYQVMKIP